MAEKEERIWIGTTEKKIQLKQIQLKQMTRTEAINRMAKAIWETGYNEVLNISFDKLKTKSDKSKSTTFGNFYKLTMEKAEAALNALLGDK